MQDTTERGDFWRGDQGLITRALFVFMIASLWFGLVVLAWTSYRSTMSGFLAAAVMVLGMLGAVSIFVSGYLLLLGVVRIGISSAKFPELMKMQHREEQVIDLLRSANDRLLISDEAKRIAYREKDREALRAAIREDIHKRDYDAALVLVSRLSETYGYQGEAEDFQEQIRIAREAEQEQKVAEAIVELDRVLAAYDWDTAAKQAAKVQRMYPDSPRVKGLHRRVSDAREQRKRDLEQQFFRAAERDDVDRAIELLRELDRYLSEAEAAPLLETARGVIGKKRDNLGVQFKLAIHDKDWLHAVRVGEQVIKEFPNTKMADEVRGMLDLLRERAAGQRAAQGG
jgi:hypothetical protein